MAQTLVNIGAEFGNVDVKEILLSRTALSRTTLSSEYNYVKESLRDKLKKHNLAFTTDMWSDDYSQRSFMTLTCHYINDDFHLKVNVLGNREFHYGNKSNLKL